jgi:hypothetical protein
MVISISDVLSLIGTVVNINAQVKTNKRQVGFLIEKIQKIEPYMHSTRRWIGIKMGLPASSGVF